MRNTETLFVASQRLDSFHEMCADALLSHAFADPHAAQDKNIMLFTYANDSAKYTFIFCYDHIIRWADGRSIVIVTIEGRNLLKFIRARSSRDDHIFVFLAGTSTVAPTKIDFA